MIGSKSFGATLALTLMVSAGTAHASAVFSSFTESTFTVSGPGNNAFCSGTGSGGTCDFKGGATGNTSGSVNAPTITSSTSGTPGFQPVTSSSNSSIIGQTGGGVLEWWTVGNYANSTSVTNGARTNFALPNPTVNVGPAVTLFSNTSFFPPGGNDTSTFLTAEFTGKVAVGAGNSLSFTGSVDDNILIYYRTDGTSGPYTLLAVSPNNLTNQASFPFSSALLGAGTYDFEIFYADRSSTQASLILDATVTAAVPEASTWAMMILGFLGLGFLGYRRRNAMAFKAV